MYKILLYALIILTFAWAALIAVADVVIKAI